MRRKTIVPALAAAALCTFATPSLWAQAMSSGPAVTKAIAVLHATKSGGEAHGEVTFTKVEGGVRVVGEIRGLTPGEHGFHIHEFGDVSSPDAMSAGGHFNPDKAEHSGPHADKRHVGDLGNIKAGEDGVAKVMVKDKMLSLSGPHSIVGRSVIVHAKADDLKSQPSGDAGGRVACGVVGIAKAGAMKK
jgi:superoxide dismutase, Cu-Zn family